MTPPGTTAAEGDAVPEDPPQPKGSTSTSRSQKIHTSRSRDPVTSPGTPPSEADLPEEPSEEDWTSADSEEVYIPNKGDMCSDDTGSEVDMRCSDDDLLCEVDMTKVLPKTKSAVQGSSTSKSITRKIHKASFKSSSFDHVTSSEGSGRSASDGGVLSENWTSADIALPRNSNSDCEADGPTFSAPTVPAVVKKLDGKRVHNKTHYCQFCDKEVKCFARHLERNHKTNIEVAKALSYNKNSKERKRQLELIRKVGGLPAQCKCIKEWTWERHC